MKKFILFLLVFLVYKEGSAQNWNKPRHQCNSPGCYPTMTGHSCQNPRLIRDNYQYPRQTYQNSQYNNQVQLSPGWNDNTMYYRTNSVPNNNMIARQETHSVYKSTYTHDTKFVNGVKVQDESTFSESYSEEVQRNLAQYRDIGPWNSYGYAIARRPCNVQNRWDWVVIDRRGCLHPRAIPRTYYGTCPSRSFIEAGFGVGFGFNLGLRF